MGGIQAPYLAFRALEHLTPAPSSCLCSQTIQLLLCKHTLSYLSIPQGLCTHSLPYRNISHPLVRFGKHSAPYLAPVFRSRLLWKVFLVFVLPVWGRIRLTLCLCDSRCGRIFCMMNLLIFLCFLHDVRASGPGTNFSVLRTECYLWNYSNDDDY